MLLDAINVQKIASSMCAIMMLLFFVFFCPSRRSFHSLEQLSAEVSLNSDSQKADGRQNGDSDWTSAGKKYLSPGIDLIISNNGDQ